VSTNAGQSNDQLLVFTSSSLTGDNRWLVFTSDRTEHPGHLNRFALDQHTGAERQLTDHQDGYHKSYVYFDGNPNRGFSDKIDHIYVFMGRNEDGWPMHILK
jgi:Tol biopolymer transport system component